MTVTIRHGDCREILQTLPDQSVHCCVTSPPYFGLRDYGTAKWDGGDAGCDHVSREKPPTINSSSTLGFPAGGGPRRIAEGNTYHEAYKQQFRDICGKCDAIRVDNQIGLEATPDAFVVEMVAVFREVRRVLRDDGTLWLNLGDSYGRGERVKNVNDSKRGTGHHAAITSASAYGAGPRAFLRDKDLIGIPWRVAFALQADGWYLRQDIIWSKPNPMPESVTDRCTKAHEYLFLLTKSARYYYDAAAIAEAAKYAGDDRGARPDIRRGTECNSVSGKTGDTRNKRSVWEVTTSPYAEAHFATFPPDLIEPCIKAGCPKDGTVLDPFGGAGTTGLVADRLGRDAILIELNPEYAHMAQRRIEGDAGMFAEVLAVSLQDSQP